MVDLILGQFKNPAYTVLIFDLSQRPSTSFEKLVQRSAKHHGNPAHFLPARLTPSTDNLRDCLFIHIHHLRKLALRSVVRIDGSLERRQFS